MSAVCVGPRREQGKLLQLEQAYPTEISISVVGSYATKIAAGAPAKVVQTRGEPRQQQPYRRRSARRTVQGQGPFEPAARDSDKQKELREICGGTWSSRESRRAPTVAFELPRVLRPFFPEVSVLQSWWGA